MRAATHRADLAKVRLLRGSRARSEVAAGRQRVSFSGRPLRRTEQPRTRWEHKEDTAEGHEVEDELIWDLPKPESSEAAAAPQRQAGASPAGSSPSTSQRQPFNKQQQQVCLSAGQQQLQQLKPQTLNANFQGDYSAEGRGRVQQNGYQSRSSEWNIGSKQAESSIQSFKGNSKPRRHSRNEPLTHRERLNLQLRCNTSLQELSSTLEENAAALRKSSPGAHRALQDFLSGMEAIVDATEPHMDAVNLATAFRQLYIALETTRPSPSVIQPARELLCKLIDIAARCATAFKLQPINQVVGALAKMSVLGRANPLPPAESPPGRLLRELLEALALKALRRFTELPEVDPQDLCLTVWAFSRLGLNPLDGDLMDAALAALRPQLSKTPLKSLSILMVSAATVDHRLSEELLTAIAEQAVLKMPQASAQGASNLLWSFARLSGTSPFRGDLFRSGISRAIEVSDALEVQHVGNILWAAELVGHPISPQTLDALATAALRDMHNAGPAAVAGQLLALRRLNANPLGGRLVLAALEQGNKVLAECNRHTISNILWSVSGINCNLPSAQLELLNGRWAERCLALLADGIGEAHWGQNLAISLLAYSRLRLDPLQGRLFQEALTMLDGRMNQLSAQNASNVLLAAAICQRRSFSEGTLTDAVTKVATEGNPQEVCNTLWSLTALGAMTWPALENLLQRFRAEGGCQEMALQHANQIMMADMALKLLHKEEAAWQLPEDIAAAVEECLGREGKQITISAFHEEVSGTLEAMGLPHAVEFASPNGLLSIDIVMRCGDGGPLAVEVDGERHFTALPPHRPLGATVLRNRLIAANGFRGLGVPFYDWNRLRTDEERSAYLAARLSKWGIAPVEPVAATF